MELQNIVAYHNSYNISSARVPVRRSCKVPAQCGKVSVRLFFCVWWRWLLKRPQSLLRKQLGSVMAFHWLGRRHKICHFHHVVSWVNLFPAAFFYQIYVRVGLWPWSRGRPDRSTRAARFNRRIALTKGCKVGRVYLITKRERGVRTGSPTVCVLWEVGVSSPHSRTFNRRAIISARILLLFYHINHVSWKMKEIKYTRTRNTHRGLHVWCKCAFRV